MNPFTPGLKSDGFGGAKLHIPRTLLRTYPERARLIRKDARPIGGEIFNRWDSAGLDQRAQCKELGTDPGRAEEAKDRPVHPAVLPAEVVWEADHQGRRARAAAVLTFQL